MDKVNKFMLSAQRTSVVIVWTKETRKSWILRLRATHVNESLNSPSEGGRK